MNTCAGSALRPSSDLACCLPGGFNPQFFPKLSGIAALFSRTLTAASLWLHLLAVNLFAARTAYLEGGCMGRRRGGRSSEQGGWSPSLRACVRGGKASCA
jgi:hypothetical protein